MLTVATLRALMPLAGKAADVYAPLIGAAFTRYNVKSAAAKAAFLANVAEETRQLNAIVECCNYRDPARLLAVFPNDFKDLADATAVQKRGEQAIANRIYANQNGNGNEASGDGWKFRGRGLAQDTGRNAYNAAGHGLGLDLLNHPELLEVPEHATNSAGLFWLSNKLSMYADAGNFQAVCGIWNVGNPHATASAVNGFAERFTYYHRFLTEFNK